MINAATPLPQHPRLLLPAGEEKKLWNKINANAVWKTVHQVIIDESDKLIAEKPIEHIKIGIRLLDKSRECLRRVYFLSYAWRMTQDKKYLERGEKELLAVAAFSDWNPTHYLDVAEMTMGVAIGYDWLYNGLSEKSRSIIREAIISKGLETSFDTVHFNHYRKWLSVTNNWNQVCNAGLSFGALAVYESYPALAAKLINRSVESIAIPMNEAYGNDGAYPEGYMYWGYGTTMNVMLLDALEKIFHTDFGLMHAAGFLKTPYYVENMVAPSGDTFNYSDEGQQSQIQPAMFWFTGKLEDPSLLWEEQRLLTQQKIQEESINRLLPSLLLWGSNIDIDKINPPIAKAWMGQGKNPVAAMRTSWTDSNAIYVGLKAGSPFVTHGHMDVGSFIMEADGERWAMDFGMQEYESLESKKIDLWDNTQNGQRWKIFRYNNFTHNTLTINNQLQQVDGFAPITGFSKDINFLQATTDLSAIYKGQLAKANRGVAIVQQQYVLVQDELETAAAPASVRWTMLTDATVDIIDSETVALKKNGKQCKLQVKDVSGIILKKWTTNPPNDYDAPNPGTTLVGFEYTIPAYTKRNVTVLLLPERSSAANPLPVKMLAQWPNTLPKK
ncbi:MAG: heparinase II/III family protein [Chitinophagaceae bacterium]